MASTSSEVNGCRRRQCGSSFACHAAQEGEEPSGNFSSPPWFENCPARGADLGGWGPHLNRRGDALADEAIHAGAACPAAAVEGWPWQEEPDCPRRDANSGRPGNPASVTAKKALEPGERVPGSTSTLSPSQQTRAAGSPTSKRLLNEMPDLTILQSSSGADVVNSIISRV